MKALSLRARLTLWYTCVLVVVLCIGGADLLWVLGRLGVRRVDRELDATIVTVANVVRGELAEHGTAADAAAEACSTVATDGRAIAVLDANGRPLDARWSGLDPALSLAAIPAARDAVAITVRTPAGDWRLHASRRAFTPATTLVVVAASPLTDVMRERRQVLEAMLYGIPVLLVFAAGGGLWLAAVGLRPLTAMAQRARELSLGGVDDLGPPPRRDEIGQLATAFNALVARLRAALHTQRQFMADASHELRTPVSVIRTAADVSLSRDRRPEREYRETMAIIRSEAVRLGRLVADMLTLARADAGGYPLRPVDLYLDEVIADCVRGVALVAQERGVVLSMPALAELPVRGDEQLLHELVRNIVQNAIQHTPAGGRVTVAVQGTPDSVTIDVTDGGPGIPAADRARIFDRFVQLDPARRSDGSGLGLPIARWIAEAHGGSLELTTSGPEGSTFRITLPVSRLGRQSSVVSRRSDVLSQSSRSSVVRSD